MIEEFFYCAVYMGVVATPIKNYACMVFNCSAKARSSFCCKMTVLVLLAPWLLSVTVLSAHGQNCDNIGTLLNCGYNQTVYGSPNYTANPNIDSISSATFYLPQLSEVIELGCSTQMVRFGCATLFPRCTTGLGPCRSLCHRINTDCAADLLEQLQAASLVLAPLLRCDK